MGQERYKRPEATTAGGLTDNGTSQYVVNIDKDRRIGICECLPGYVVLKQVLF